MQVQRIEQREQEIMAKLRSRPRLEGQHLTDAIYCNVKAWGFARLSAAGQEVPHDDATLLRFLRGTWREAVLSEGEMTQMQTISADDESVGTIDIWRGFVVESKSSEYSVNKDVAEIDHWMTQIGGYVARNLKDGAKTAKGELWVINEHGDHGKKFCPEHGYPEKQLRRKYEETSGMRAICSECLERDGVEQFLADGNRDPTLRCYEIRWTREELESLHKILTWRLAQLKEDIENPAYAIGNPPEQRHGYEFECKGCPVGERIGCAGRDVDDLEEQLQGSVSELEERILAKA